jgi:alcohol dehydrogenase class IV
MGGSAFRHESRAQRIVLGAGVARTELAAEVAAVGGTRVLLIAAPAEAGLAEQLTRDLPVVGTFDGVREHVPVEVAEAARTLATRLRADVLVCVGGGSTTGTAKAVAMTSGLPIVAVPTTYAGSEATAVWGLTERGRKTTGTDPSVLPRSVVYDPELTVTLPVDLTVASGLNAMAHCVDSLWGPDANPVSEALAVAGARNLRQGLPAVRLDGTDLAARADVLGAAYLAATAFASAGSGLHHKICHVLGGTYALPHAATHAVVLPHVAAFNVPLSPTAGSALALAMGRDDGVTGLRDLYLALDAPTALRDLGLAESDLPEAVGLVVEAAPASNPRPVDTAGIEQLLRAAWSGEPAGTPPATTRGHR